MLQNPFAPRPLAAERVPWLRGTLKVPGDAIVADLALCCATLARGNSMVEGAPPSRGMAQLTDALRALGARIEDDEGRCYITGLGAGGLLEPQSMLDLSASMLATSLIAGLAGIYDFPTALRGADDTGSRSTRQLVELLAQLGVSAELDPARQLIRLRGPKLAMPSEILLPPAAPALRAAAMLGALSVPGTSSLIDLSGGWDNAERALRLFGAEIAVSPAEATRRLDIIGLPALKAQQIAVPADPSLAAFGAVAASVVPASEILIENVLVNPTRTAILSALVAFGAQIGAHNLRTVNGEEVADLSIRQAGMTGVALSAQHVATVLADLPLLAVAAAFAEGETTFHLPPNLPMLERARIADIARGLSACGVACEAEEEVFVVHGAVAVAGGATVPAEDPEMALAFLVLGMAAREQVTIADESVIEERFPGFVERFENIGASFIRDPDASGEDRG